MSSCQDGLFDYPGRDEDLKRQLREDTKMNNSIEVLTEEVYAHLEVEGVHWWADCPLEEVSYLKYPHRHIFHIDAYAYVSHSDRDIEFIVLKHKIADYLKEKYWDKTWKLLKFGGMSCEMIAKELIAEFNLYKCHVSEDGENGGIVTKENL